MTKIEIEKRKRNMESIFRIQNQKYFTHISELVSPPSPSILKTPEGCKDKSCVFVFLYFYPPSPSPHTDTHPHTQTQTHTNVWYEYQDRLKNVGLYTIPRNVSPPPQMSGQNEKCLVLHTFKNQFLHLPHSLLNHTRSVQKQKMRFVFPYFYPPQPPANVKCTNLSVFDF